VSELAGFRAKTRRVEAELAKITSTELKPQIAESLVVLNEAGAIVVPALRKALAEDPTALDLAINGPITSLVAAASQGSLPNPIIWGNVASVINSAFGILSAEFPDGSQQARAIATAALQAPPLALAWTGDVGDSFRRTTCCQVTARDERRCGDCVRLEADR
jgi:hypothetical protein